VTGRPRGEEGRHSLPNELGRPEESRGGPANCSDADQGDPVPVLIRCGGSAVGPQQFKRRPYATNAANAVTCGFLTHLTQQTRANAPYEFALYFDV
jgi:hypothetical protein